MLHFSAITGRWRNAFFKVVQVITRITEKSSIIPSYSEYNQNSKKYSEYSENTHRILSTTYSGYKVELESWHMDDAKIGEGRKETTVFRREQIEKMGEWRFQNKSLL